MTNNHCFHIVDKSPWPLINSFNLMNLIINFLSLMKLNSSNLMLTLISLILMIFSSFSWWRDTIREASFQGFHTKKVNTGLKMGMMLFILSEIMFFLSFFWAMFYYSLAPEMEIGNNWPPMHISPFNPYQIPLLNSIILISSGVTVTWCHHSITNKDFTAAYNSLFLTIYLGMIFTIFQIIEYKTSLFSINDSSYGTIFFMSTGFHGFHVLVGTLFLTINLMRMNFSQFNNKHHFSFEAAAWYWHFVDVVWIFLYTFAYWWFY